MVTPQTADASGFTAAPALVLDSPAFQVRRPFVFNIGLMPPQILAASEAVWGRGDFPARPVNIFRLKNAYLLHEGVVFDRELNVFQPSVAPSRPDEIALFRTWLGDGLRTGHVASARGLAILGIGRASANYYHYLIEMFARSVIGEQAFGHERPFHVLHRVRSGVLDVARQALSMIGIGLDRLLVLGHGPTRFDELVVVQGLTEHGQYMSPLCIGALATVADHVPAGPDQAVFVMREPDRNRPLLNQDTLAAALAAAGYRVIRPWELSWAEQIATFHGARVVVGVMGAALANVAFCEPGARVVMVGPAGYPDTTIFFICAHRGHEYMEMRGAQVDPHDWNNGFTLTDQDIRILASL
jgi:Glycosyltransferase 61